MTTPRRPRSAAHRHTLHIVSVITQPPPCPFHHAGNNNHEKARLELDSRGAWAAADDQLTSGMPGCVSEHPLLPVSDPATAKGTCTLARAHEKKTVLARAGQEPKLASHSQSQIAKHCLPRTNWTIPPIRDIPLPDPNCARSLQVILVHVAATLALGGGRRRSTKSARSPMPSPIQANSFALPYPGKAAQPSVAGAAVGLARCTRWPSRYWFLPNYTLS